MAPNNENATAANPIPRGQENENQNTTAAKAQDQTLLKALQDLIVRVVDSDPKQTNERNQIPLGPEAGKLLTALQEFISSIVVRSQSEAQNTILKVSPGKADFDDDGENIKSSSKGDFLQKVPSELNENPTKKINSGALVVQENRQPTFKEKLFTALREHVFNKLPIRMLCFEPHGSSFQISLLERAAIYGRIASVLEERMDGEEFRPCERSVLFPTREVRMETEQEIIQRLVSKYARYAIFSHTWLRMTPGEVTYGDWNKRPLDTKGPGYRKLVSFCKATWENYQLTFGWMDTVCINKESSSELDESIRSMYNWYSHAAICITYLAETETLANMHLDPWFTRGWTLQELFAPEVIKFYNSRWKQLVDYSNNDKEAAEITKQIKKATKITAQELKNIRNASISRRMELAAPRDVTREEDTAYSLMGIFNVGISTAYGEGAAHAFFRLLQEILVSHENVLDVLNWAGEFPSSQGYTSKILPTSPKCYINRSSSKSLLLGRPAKPLTLSHLGLRVPVVLMPGRSIQGKTSQFGAKGDYGALVDIYPVGRHVHIPTAYHLLDNRISGSDSWKIERSPNTGAAGGKGYQITFAIFNFTEARNIASLPKTCIAIALEYKEEVGKVSDTARPEIIRTNEPIVFELNKTNTLATENREWKIPMDELAKHGMQLISLYL
ncbi:hypothetical protein BJ912DRAFT_909078 [Pholiota molesta]|nr:hypothetical protein BJ912DRAFT_909078 [Pholiota molesta]